MRSDPEFLEHRRGIARRSSERRQERMRTDPSYREKMNAAYRQGYARKREERKAKARARDAAHREEINARDRAKYAEQRVARRAYLKDWSARNPARVEAYRRANDHNRRNAPGSFTAAEWRQVLHRNGHRCFYCGAWGITLWVDHRIPLRRGGWNVASNIVPACRSCNLSKGALTDLAFMARRARDGARAYDPAQQIRIWVAGFGAVAV